MTIRKLGPGDTDAAILVFREGATQVRTHFETGQTHILFKWKTA